MKGKGRAKVVSGGNAAQEKELFFFFSWMLTEVCRSQREEDSKELRERVAGEAPLGE